jgi:starch synthase
MRILLASSELHPYSKTGGLADMVAALAKSLGRSGHQVGVVTPLYDHIPGQFPETHPSDLHVALPLGDATVAADVWTVAPDRNVTVYFIDQPGFYRRTSLYLEHGVDYPDNAERFIFLSKCVAHLARHLPWQPEIVHVHDWHVALTPLFIRDQKLGAGWGNAPPTCLTLHNLAFQGSFPAEKYALTNLPSDYFGLDGAEFFGRFNCLKAGICFADLITTVSPRYAREITTEQFGCRLDAVLRARVSKLVGILNGVDYDEWDPAHDALLHQSYTADDLSGKASNKLGLQQELSLAASATTPLFGSVSRLADQKGVDIQLGALEEMLAAELQFITLGTGAAEYEAAYQELASRYPQRVAARAGYDQALAHRIEASCDFYLMPSKFEPCGLNQMYSLRYGTIPIVRATGGLDDSVVDITEDRQRANGIKFYEYSARALAKAIRKALVLYQEPELLAAYRHNAMTADFSWSRATTQYVDLYRRLVAG